MYFDLKSRINQKYTDFLFDVNPVNSTRVQTLMNTS